MNGIEKVKAHWNENKKVYLVGLGGLAAGVLFAAPIIHRKEMTTMMTRSNASKPVHLVGTNLYFSSLTDAAHKTGHSLSQISENVHGKIPNLKGDVFEVLEPA